MAKQGEIKGWITINGVHRPLFEGETSKDVYNRLKEQYNKGKNKKHDKKSMKILTADEYYKYRKEKIDRYNELEEQKKEELKEMKNSKLSDDDKWKKQVDIENKYDKLKREETGFKNIYDSKKDEYMLIDNDNVFKDKLYKENSSHENKDISKLSENEKLALTRYTSQYGYGNYSDVNGLLYNPDKGFYSKDNEIQTKEAIKNIDSAMKKCTLGQDCQVYRGIESSKLNNEKIAKVVDKFNKAVDKGGMTGLEKNMKELESLKGTVIDNKGYMSTSATFDSNYSKRGVTLVINAKSSDKAIHIQSLSKYGGKQDAFMAAFSKGGIQHENEILFDRGTKLKITDVAVTRSGVQLLCDTE